MRQAVWTGSVNFGLVSIPVKLYPATEPKDVRFHLYDRRSGKRVRYERVTRDDEPAAFTPDPSAMGASGHDQEERDPVGRYEPAVAETSPTGERAVDVDSVVRGFALASGDLVTLSDEELGSIAPERSRTIDIEEFVDLAEIDPVFFEKSYHVAPVRRVGADKPYVLLLRAMQAARMVAIGRFVLRTRPHLVAIRPLERALGLETLFFGDEVRSPDEIVQGLPDLTVSDRELKTAQQLIRALATEWSPAKHADVYRDELLALLRSKPATAPADVIETADAQIGDLMAALKASVEAAKRRTEGARSPRSKRVG